MYCKKCGAEMADDAVFCSKCGWTKGAAGNSAGNSSSNKKLIAIIISLCVVIVVGLIAGIIVISGNSSDSKNIDPQKPSIVPHSDGSDHDGSDTGEHYVRIIVRGKIGMLEGEERTSMKAYLDGEYIGDVTKSKKLDWSGKLKTGKYTLRVVRNTDENNYGEAIITVVGEDLFEFEANPNAGIFSSTTLTPVD